MRGISNFASGIAVKWDMYTEDHKIQSIAWLING